MTKSYKITGTHIAYYYICHTKLWLFSHKITMEQDSETVKIGKLIESLYTKKTSSLQLENIKIDFVRSKNKIVIHEIKKSKALEKAHEMQLSYYLYILKKKGICGEGVLNYPKSREIKKVELTEEREREIRETITKIRKIIDATTPPKPIKKKYCKKCSYYELCWV